MKKHRLFICAALTFLIAASAWSRDPYVKSITLSGSSISRYFEDNQWKYIDVPGGSIGLYGTGVARMNTNLRLNQDGYYIELDGNPN
ncbi:MAG: hypothetical protein AB1728_02580 [Bacteroidota bacterium]